MKPFSPVADDIFRAFLKAVEARDTYTQRHMGRTAALATAVGRRLGLSRSQLDVVGAGAVLHDVGKIGIPDRILNRPGRLTCGEFEIIKRHPVIGQQITSPMRPTPALACIIRNHHERLDGTGYPDGLRGDQIPLATRIVCVTEIYDALATDRPYRNALERERICDILRHEAARGWWDADVVEVAIDVAEGARPRHSATA